MAVLETIPGAEDYVRKRIVEDRATHQVVSEELKLLHPWISRGLSSRSIRRFCEAHDFHATSRLVDSQLDMVVKTSIHKVSLAWLPLNYLDLLLKFYVQEHEGHGNSCVILQLVFNV